VLADARAVSTAGCSLHDNTHFKRKGRGFMSYSPEWIPAGFVGLVALLCVPPLAMIAFGVILLGALAALVALAGAIVATPYLLFRSVRSRLAQNEADRRNAMPTSPG
jgi:hypothetical protein